MNEVFVVERHDDEYYGPHRQRLAVDLETAFEVAAEQRGEHCGEQWSWRSSEHREVLIWSANSATGWVTIHKQQVRS